jgi:hypothetical protein
MANYCRAVIKSPRGTGAISLIVSPLFDITINKSLVLVEKFATYVVRGKLATILVDTC